MTLSGASGLGFSGHVVSRRPRDTRHVNKPMTVCNMWVATMFDAIFDYIM